MIAAILLEIKQQILETIKDWGVEEEIEIFFDIPKDNENGDYSTNIAMRLARILKKSPQEIALALIDKIGLQKNHLKALKMAGAGFINLYLDENYLARVIHEINRLGDDFGNLTLGNEYINLEFVSANPTGYLHVGHCRGAAYGDSLARILIKAGFRVAKEHYVNDAGNQINNLAYSIYERYKELFNIKSNMQDGYYFGAEIITIAKQIKAEYEDKFLHEEWFDFFRKYGIDLLLAGLKSDLENFNVQFDIWFSEKSLYDQNLVKNILLDLEKKGYTYQQEGAIWLKSSLFGDEKDRVLVKSDQSLTYITPDIAYHLNKFNRGFDHLIDVLGADHHGYIGRLRAAMAMLGENPEKLDIEILQMVRVIQNGVELKMSKRSGKAITLRDLLDEVGSDALRFFFVSKALSSHMDLDLDLAIKQSNENPVYYIQYAYARICSLFRNFAELGHTYSPVTTFAEIDLEKIDKIVRLLLQYPDVIKEAALKRIPHRLAQYAISLATAFHSYYNDEKIITENIKETNEKLHVMRAVQIVLKNSLHLIGVGIKEKM